MISVKWLVWAAKQWQKVVTMKIGKIMSPSRLKMALRKPGGPVARKGHVVLYSLDGTRFMVPVRHLNSPVFKELFKLSEDEFGFPVNGPITLPCSGMFMEYAISAVRQRIPKTVEEYLIISVSSIRCPPVIFSHDRQGQADHRQQLLLNAF